MIGKTDLQTRYSELINDILPQEIQQPIRFNHCFGRVVLDWLFQDVWYKHIEKRPAYKQLSEEQLKRAISRMEKWLEDREMLVADNRASLNYRASRK
ncbi:MAG: hypothetical protein AAGI23_07555 [Bacteroidota bacterium]